MNRTGLLPALYGLGAAAAWGAADFAGGMGARLASVYRLVLAGEWIGLAALAPWPLILREALPAARDWVLSGLAGLAGLVGIIFLYRSLSEGQMSVAAPLSALLAAIIPVGVGALTQGLPSWLTLIGIGLALVAIWLISSNNESTNSLQLRWATLKLPLSAGVTFGVYFVLMHASSQQSTFWPLISARLVSAVLLTVWMLLTKRLGSLPSRVWALALGYGTLDVAANLMFVLSGQVGRLDIAAVLGSLYPGVTVMLAWLLLKERLSRTQWLGVLAALAAIPLIAGG